MARWTTAGVGVVVSLLCLLGMANPAAAAPVSNPGDGGPGQVPTNFLVVTDTTTIESVRVIRQHGGRVLQAWPEIGVVVAEASSPGFAATLRRVSSIAAVGATRNLAAKPPAQLADVRTAPRLGAGSSGGDDAAEADFDRQWNLRMIDAPAAHRVTDGSRDITVGILDSGIDPDHPDLKANVDPDQSVGCAANGVPDTSPAAWRPADTDSGTAGHGTHVAGIVGAARNQIGVVGVAPGVRLASVKVVDAEGYVYPEYALCGIMWAAEHTMEVTNNSYLVDPWARWCSNDPDQAAISTALRRALSYSEQQGVVSVVAAGNGKTDLTTATVDDVSPNNGAPQRRTLGEDCQMLPAGLPGVVSVSAVGPTGEKAYYSNYGLGAVDVAAPGGDGWLDWASERPTYSDTIWSTLPGGRYGWLQGTSMAAPHVAGVVALMRSVHPDRTPAQVREALRDEARPLACPTDYDYNGDGRVDARCEGKDGAGFYGAGMVDALAAVTQ